MKTRGSKPTTSDCRFSFYGLELDLLRTADVLKRVDRFLESDSPHTIFFLNAHCYNLAQRYPSYRETLQNADLLLNDGAGVEIGCLLKGQRPPENLNGTDLIPKIIRHVAEKENNVFLLGGRQSSVSAAASNLSEGRNQRLVAGYHSGYFPGEHSTSLLHRINESGATVLIVGMGVPRQELWISENLGQLSTVRLVIAGGAIIDFISGAIPRASRLLRSLRIEWLHRLWLEPKRLWQRYLIGNIEFLFRILLSPFCGQSRRRPPCQMSGSSGTN